jgi:hypothetical protein
MERSAPTPSPALERRGDCGVVWNFAGHASLRLGRERYFMRSFSSDPDSDRHQTV